MAALAAGGLSIDLPAGWDGAIRDGGADAGGRHRAPRRRRRRHRTAALHPARRHVPPPGGAGRLRLRRRGADGRLRHPDLPPRARARGGRHGPVPPPGHPTAARRPVLAAVDAARPARDGRHAALLPARRSALLPLRRWWAAGPPAARSCAPRTRSSRPFASTLPLAEGFVPRGVRPYDRPTMSDSPEPGADRAAWRALASKDLKGADPDTLVWETPEGIAVQPLYTAADLDGLDHVDTHPRGAAVRAGRARHDVHRPARGRSASTPGSPPPRSRTPSTGATWPPASRACRWPSTSPPTAATTPTTPAWSATSARPGWRSTPSRT